MMICLTSLFQAKLGLSDGTTQAARTLKDRKVPCCVRGGTGPSFPDRKTFRAVPSNGSNVLFVRLDTLLQPLHPSV